MECMLPTTVIIGPSDTGKTFLTELAMTVIGNNRQTGRAFSYNNITEFEFGKRVAQGYLPIIVNDPPLTSAMAYAEIVVGVADGARRDSSALKYTPGAAPILCVNPDFYRKWQKMDPDAW